MPSSSSLPTSSSPIVVVGASRIVFIGIVLLAVVVCHRLVCNSHRHCSAHFCRTAMYHVTCDTLGIQWGSTGDPGGIQCKNGGSGVHAVLKMWVLVGIRRRN